MFWKSLMKLTYHKLIATFNSFIFSKLLKFTAILIYLRRFDPQAFQTDNVLLQRITWCCYILLRSSQNLCDLDTKVNPQIPRKSAHISQHEPSNWFSRTHKLLSTPSHHHVEPIQVLRSAVENCGAVYNRSILFVGAVYTPNKILVKSKIVLMFLITKWLL